MLFEEKRKKEFLEMLDVEEKNHEARKEEMNRKTEAELHELDEATIQELNLQQVGLPLLF